VKAIRVHACGGPEAMALEELPLPSPGPGQVLVEVKAAGVNLFDTQLRSGLYKRDLPLTIGLEGAGLVQALGADGKLAMASVDTVPAGKYGKAALTYLGVWDAVAPRVAQAENVRAALAFVARGETPLGIVYATGQVRTCR